MPPVPIDEPLGYRRGRRVSCNEAVGTAPIPHGHAIVNSPPPNLATAESLTATQRPKRASPQVAQYGRVVRRRALQRRLFKTGGRLIRHALYFILELAQSHLTPTLFRQILGRIERLAWHPT